MFSPSTHRTAWLLLASSLVGSAFPQDDVARSKTDGDPLAWTNGQVVHFVVRAGSGGTELKSGPDPAYPVMKKLAPGAPMLVVGDRNEHLAVLVPEGYRAFVKSEFVALKGDGTGVVKGDAVNLRSRPAMDADYPIERLPNGRLLEVIGPTDPGKEWMEVVAPGDVPLWVSDVEVEMKGDLSESGFRAEIAAARERRRADWIDHSSEAREAEARRARDAELRTILASARADLKSERERGGEADYTAIRGKLADVVSGTNDASIEAEANALLGDIDADEKRAAREREVKAEAKRLKAELEIERQRLADAERRAVDEAKNVVGPRITVGDSGTVSGFLRRKGTAPFAFALERGTTTTAWLKSANGRYRLDDFIGLQLEVTGRYVTGGDTPTVEVDRLVIMKH